MGRRGVKKCRKLRGHVSHGGGRVGKNRKHPAGRGNAGGQHHQRIFFDKYHPGYFGKVGMRHFRLHKNRSWENPINVDRVWTLVKDEKQRQELLGRKDGKATIIDVTQFGYTKVLGAGMIPKAPVIVRARAFSEKAEEKIKAVGGACELCA
eukprot:gb/GECH01011187.1/.p1 GENE.gb/GECH01011187.1/~~gb/GECH01011187.1/.p1  ORF type:complete len:151 (+),score=23.21 gb/GECH01011187.1/:1-453(+)